MIQKGGYVSLNVNEVKPTAMSIEQGWKKMDMRVVIGDVVGVDQVCVFRAVFQPGAAHEKHLHPRAAEFAYIV